MIIIKERLNNFNKTVINSIYQRVSRNLNEIYAQNDKIVPNETRTDKFHLCLLDGTLKAIYDFIPDSYTNISRIKEEVFKIETAVFKLASSLQ
jgi:hypothetical protein